MKPSDPIATLASETLNSSNSPSLVTPIEKLAGGEGPPTTHYYRIGLIGAKASGKTCLLAALNMQMTVNPRGYHAVMLALHGGEPAPLRDGHKWISDACEALRNPDGPRWPPFTPSEDRQLTVRFQFSDGATRKKTVELFDYSGELVNPKLAQSKRAANLRQLLREMDALIVLAEHPMPGQDSPELGESLNGLLGVFALLVDQRKANPEDAVRQIPIALIVNKWDRSGHLKDTNASEMQERFLQQFLASDPPPFHQNMMNAMRPVSGGRLKAFPVSACGPCRSVGEGNEMKESPPAQGLLQSFGVQDPFLWVIEQRDDLDLIRANERLDSLSWLAFPWSPWRELRRLNSQRSRFEKPTPEGKRLVPLARNARWLIVRQVFIYVFAALLIEAGTDLWGHRKAISYITNPTREAGWQQGTKWLRDYGQSIPIRHSIYNLLRLRKQAALDQAYQIERQKDDSLLASSRKALQEGNLEEAERLAGEHKKDFPRSSNTNERDPILAKVDAIRRDLTFEKLLNRWRQDLTSLRPVVDDAERITKGKLEKLSGLLCDVRDTQSVPLEGRLRKEWTALLVNIDTVRADLAERLKAIGLAGKIRQAMDAEDYLQAADLLASPEFQRTPDADLLRSFQLSLGRRVQERCDTLGKQGESWRDAVLYAQQFLVPARRTVVPAEVKDSIDKTIQKNKESGDKYLYELARFNKSNETLNRYLAETPLPPMVTERDGKSVVIPYINWLQYRETPRKLIFRLVKIHWTPGSAKGWRGYTLIKLSVNGVGDNRNEQLEDNRRTGETSTAEGVRVVTFDNLAQTTSVRVVLECYHSGWGGDFKSSMKVEISPEKLVEQSKQGAVRDSADNRIEIEIDGVTPEPFLPPWHPPQ